MAVQPDLAPRRPPPLPPDVVDPADIVDRFIAGLRRRVRRLERTRALLSWLASIGASLFVCAIGAGYLPAQSWQILLGLLSVTTTIVIVARHSDRVRARRDVAFLRSLDVPHDRVGGLLALVELDEKPAYSDRKLVAIFRRRVAGQLAGEKLGDWLPGARLGGALVAFSLVLLAWAFALVVPAARARVRAGLQDLQTAADDRALPSKQPLLAELTIALTPPAYTGQPQRVLGDSTGNVRALAGSQLMLAAKPKRETKRARIVFEAEGQAARRVPLTVENGKLVARQPVAGAARYHFELEQDGVWWKEPVQRQIELEIDQAPRVELRAAADVLELAVQKPIELAYSIEDDYGLSSVELVWQPEGKPAQRRTLEAPTGAKVAQRFEWDLRELDLPSAVKISYWIEAKDNNLATGPGLGKSRVLSLMLRSAKQDHDRALSDQKALLEEAIRALADRLEHPSPAVDAQRAMHPAIVNLAQSVRAVNEATGKDKRALRDVGKKLDEMAQRLDKLAKEEDGLLGARAVTGKLHDVHTRVSGELERDVLLIEALVGRQRLEEMLRIGEELKAAKDKLKQLMAEYKNAPTEEKKREIEKQIQELAKRLQELQAKMAELKDDVPDQFVNREAAESQSMKSELDQIQKLMNEGKTADAMARLEKLSSQIDQMMASMDRDLKGYRGERFGAEEQALAQLENEIAELSHSEKEIEQETAAVREQQRKRMEDRLREKQGELKQLAEDAAKLQKMLKDTPSDALPQPTLESLNRAKETAQKLERALKPLDLEEARHQAGNTRGDLRQSKRDADEMARFEPNAKRAAQKLGDAASLAESIEKRLDELAPQSAAPPTPEERERMRQLGERQAAAKKRLDELRKKLGQGAPQSGQPGTQSGEGQPMSVPGLDDGLGQAGKHMQSAEGQLRGGKPREAEGEESQALEALGKAREQVQRERRPGNEEGGQAMDRDPVKIPGADEYQAPREFREDILDAMKRAAPERYKQQVRRYFEELVR